MHNDYFESEDFKALLRKYEASKQQGSTCYFDAEDFIDLADNYLLSDMPEEALEVIDKGLLLHGDDEDLTSTKSGAYIYMHKFDEAREIVETLSPDNPNIIYQRAQLAYAIDNDVPTSEELFGDWIEMEDENSKFADENERSDRLRDAYLHILTSFIELRGNNYDDELVKRWVEEYYARFSPLGNSEFDLMLADMVRNEGMTDMVEKIYKSLLENDPYINHGWVVLSTSQVMNGHYEDALESADFALAIDPDDSDAVLSKAHSYYSLGRKDLAIPLFRKYLDKFDDANQYLPYAISLITEERIEEAKPYLAKAEEYVNYYKEQDEYYAQAHFELAQAYFAFDIPKARECIDKAVEKSPNDLEFLMLQGTLYLALQIYEESLQIFTKCLDITDDKIRIICEIAMRFVIQQDYEAAFKILESTAEFSEGTKSYRIISGFKAYLYYCVEDAEPFLTYLKRACMECPDVLKVLFFDKFPDNIDPKDYYDYLIGNPLFAGEQTNR